MSLNIPYQGPGLDDSTDAIQPDAFTLKQQIEKYASTPAGTAPVQDTQAGSVNVLSITAPGTANDYKANSVIYSPLIGNGNTSTLGLYNFTDPNCFPLAGTAVSAGAVAAVATTLTDLSSIGYPTAVSGKQYATLYPNTATTATAAPLSFKETADGKCVGIVFTDNNALGQAEAVCINPYVSGVQGSKGSQIPNTSDDAMWMIAFETPETLSVGTSASLFTIGSVIDNTLQVAFAVVAGEFTAYVNGSQAFSYSVAPAVSTRYALGVRWQKDPYVKDHYRVSLYLAVDNTSWPTVSEVLVAMPYQASAWTGYVAHPLAQGDAGTTPVSGFGPVAAFGGQWAFTALGYQAERLSVNRATTKDEATAIFSNFATAFSLVKS